MVEGVEPSGVAAAAARVVATAAAASVAGVDPARVAAVAAVGLATEAAPRLEGVTPNFVAAPVEVAAKLRVVALDAVPLLT